MKCSICGKEKKSASFSKSQRKKTPSNRKCLACVKLEEGHAAPAAASAQAEAHSSISLQGHGHAAPLAAATSEAPASTHSKTMRRSIQAMWNDTTDDGKTMLDRVMIALHRLHTDKVARVEYRRLIGMHGGGGGTSDQGFRELLGEKMKADAKAHYGDQVPTEFIWPAPVPQGAIPEKFTQPEPFAYTFCWHAEPPFIVWHRPLMLEFERLLQSHDPASSYPEGSTQHTGPAAIGVPYWGWEHWDGQTLPHQITDATYTVRGTALTGYPQGTVITNPFRRWFAPVSVTQQRDEYFPPALTDANCTMRSRAFEDPSLLRNARYAWPQQPTPDGDPAMHDVVSSSLAEPDFKRFATMKPGYGGGHWSIEHAHNKFHNHVGGVTLGGVQGPGMQYYPDPNDPNKQEYTGTMAANQSIFDPVFWLHHSNVERQLLSWQAKWWQGGVAAKPECNPPDELMDTTLYPWTKPAKLLQGQTSWNTPTNAANDGTFRDWWMPEDLPYEYDELLKPGSPPPDAPQPGYGAEAGGLKMFARPTSKRVMLSAELKHGVHGGEYEVTMKKEEKDVHVASLSVLSALGSGCMRCEGRSCIEFDVSYHLTLDGVKQAIEDQLFVLTRNGTEVAVNLWTVEER